MPLNALKVEFLDCYGRPMSRRSGAVRPPVFGARFCETSAVTEGNPSPRLKGLQKYDPACAGSGRIRGDGVPIRTVASNLM